MSISLTPKRTLTTETQRHREERKNQSGTRQKYPQGEPENLLGFLLLTLLVSSFFSVSLCLCG
jgi:hypothetical protein